MRAYTTEEAAKFAARAVESMTRHGIAPTPRNYELWFEHAAGANPALSRAIMALEGDGHKFNEATISELYDNYLAPPDRSSAVGKTANEVFDAINRLMSMITEAGGDAGRFADSLHSYSGQLAEAPDAETVKTIVTGLLVETAGLKERNEALEGQLTDTSKEMALLRDNLEAVRREALTDPLTGIANRKAFDNILATTIAAAVADRQVFSLLMVDIDHFKKFNDSFGHALGDQVLRLVGSTLRESIKGRDTATRYGGEEFAIILPETRLADGMTVADQIRRAVESKAIRRKTTGENLARITLSIGVAEYRMDEPPGELIERADAALYTAKRSGRNRVTAETRIPVPAA